MSRDRGILQDKVAVVTGAASGIGLALAETMLSYGAKRVVLADVNEKNLAREAGSAEEAIGKVLGLRCDVTKEEDVARMIREAAEFGGGRIDLLFNNAGAGFGGHFDQQTNAHWAKAFALNFYGALYGIRAVLPIMRAQGGGHIVDIISGIALYPMAGQTMYAATKAALNGLTLALRYELWDENIRRDLGDTGHDGHGHLAGRGRPSGRAVGGSSRRGRSSKGVAKNERVVFGDQSDLGGAKAASTPRPRRRWTNTC